MTEPHTPLQRIEHEQGLVTFQSSRLRALGFVHAFTTRRGGVSEGPYASLNLDTLEKGEATDANTAVAENFRRLRRALGGERLVRVAVRQVHGREVWVPPPGPVHPRDAPEADAMVTTEPGKLLTVRVADCAPILLGGRTATGERVVAAVHAGWRGVVAGVAPAAVATMRERFGAPPEELVAAIGPCIGPAHFEVGPEVVEAFEGAGLGGTAQPGARGRPHIDLRRAVSLQLQNAGVPAERIEMSEHCTYQEAELFYSYRRDGARSGRLAAVIAIEGEGARGGG